jgi:hypothetical protein
MDIFISQKLLKYYPALEFIFILYKNETDSILEKK